MAEEAKTKEVSPEEEAHEAEVQSYLDSEGQGEVDDEMQLKYLRNRYNQIKENFKGYKVQQREAQALGRKEVLDKINKALRDNYEERKYAVCELRKMGEEIKDVFIPQSAR